jgi:hypothetical protein
VPSEDKNMNSGKRQVVKSERNKRKDNKYEEKAEVETVINVKGAKK